MDECEIKGEHFVENSSSLKIIAMDGSMRDGQAQKEVIKKNAKRGGNPQGRGGAK